MFLFPLPSRHRPRPRLRTVPLICLVRCFLFRILFSLSLRVSLFISLSLSLFFSISLHPLFISSYRSILHPSFSPIHHVCLDFALDATMSNRSLFVSLFHVGMSVCPLRPLVRYTRLDSFGYVFLLLFLLLLLLPLRPLFSPPFPLLPLFILFPFPVRIKDARAYWAMLGILGTSLKIVEDRLSTLSLPLTFFFRVFQNIFLSFFLSFFLLFIHSFCLSYFYFRGQVKILARILIIPYSSNRGPRYFWLRSKSDHHISTLNFTLHTFPV